MKRIVIGIMFVGLIIFSSGCSSDIDEIMSDVERFEQANKNMDKLNNYGMDMFMGMTFKSGGDKERITADFVGVVDGLNSTSKQKGEYKLLGITFNAEIYTELYRGKTITYTNIEGLGSEWVKEINEYDEDDYHTSLDILGNLIADDFEIEKYKDSTPELTHYKLQITKETTQKFLEIIMGYYNDDVPSDYEVIDGGAIDVYLNGDNYITRIKMNFADVVGLITEDPSEIIEEMIIVVEMYDFNQAGEVVIPDEVIDSAVLQ